MSEYVRPTVVDLFSGVGGLSLGFEQAGFDVVAAVELDPIHSAVHAYNFPNCETICQDVTKLTGSQLNKRVKRKIDVVIGGAPCQGFSLIGQRALDDPRNKLISHFLRLVVEIKPTVFVLENVKGLTLGKHQSFLEELVVEFNAAGYEVRLPWEVLNARNFGVPQDRQRLFLVGVKKDSLLPEYPKALGEISNVTCFEAIGDLPNAELFETLLATDAVRTSRQGPLSSYAKEMRCLSKNSWHYGYRRKWDSQLLTSSLRTTHSEISRKRFRETPSGTVEPISRLYKLSSDGVANTLRAGTDAARGAFTSPRPIHYKFDRCVSVREMARLHGFPDWFRFHATKWHGARQIGNAVPPPLARAIASSILDSTFKLNPTKPKKNFALGDEQMLYLDMKNASSLWGVTVPIAKRDRKSGAKKRKQHEIEEQRISAVG